MATPTADTQALVDTNVLVYAMNRAAPHHAACRALYERALAGELRLCLNAQVLFEYFAVVTHLGHMERQLSADEALLDLQALADSFQLLPQPEDLPARVMDLLRATGFSGRHVFDVQLAATMLASGVDAIYTYDERFAKIPGITTLVP
jgi:predicted nucleic acid-binding protein